MQNFECLKEAAYSEGEATVIYGDVITVTDRKYVYSSVGIDLLKLKACEGSIDCMLSVRSKGGEMGLQACVKAIYVYKEKEYTSYAQGGHVPVNGEWRELDVKFTVPDEITLKSLNLYVHQRGNEELCDFEVSDISVKKMPCKDYERVDAVGEKYTVGAIRWDAYFSTGDNRNSVSNQVARSLSPNQFQSHAPYFTKVISKNTVVFGEATMEQFEEECLLAIDAGIDYFAYCWYMGSDPMCYARRQHRVSKYNKQIKMCAIIGVYSLKDEDVTELAENMAEECYFKIDGHPLVYVYGSIFNKKSEIDKFTQMAMLYGCKRPIYITMGYSSDLFEACTKKNTGFDGSSAYSCFPYAEGEQYSDIVKRSEDRNNMRIETESVIYNVPHISMGLDFRPRVLNPVSWMGGVNYAYTGTPEEMYQHAKRTLALLDKTTLKTALIYAWNEHDEGGWICPTLTIDENGDVVKNEDGTNKMDRSHLDAIKKAISELKNNA